jgi:hypothetical protein
MSGSSSRYAIRKARVGGTVELKNVMRLDRDRAEAEVKETWGDPAFL